ncbi:MAG: alpha/beta hydrolase [Nevskiaceae bacterium]|jgi:pimeloyl-ACP methyl ester carboxylesterase|nr:alpha/beta hydrolase [Nevskiaceae bacterium]
MSAFFFGPPGRQLYGYHHAPTGHAPTAPATGAVVICPAWGQEYAHSHRAVRLLARRLSERGAHVLRFDYTGAANSWGSGTDSSIPVWVDDTHLAMNELKAISGLPSVDLLGCRVGAYVATLACVDRPDVRRLALWDPVLNGAQWVSTKKIKAQVAATVEFDSLLVSTALLEQFRAIGVEKYGAGKPQSVVVLDDDQSRVEELATALPDVRRAFVEVDVPTWNEFARMPARAISTLVDMVVAK